jgi:RimJ/RimL family protein N-acetyltransferase
MVSSPTTLSADELYRRLDQLVPGDREPDGGGSPDDMELTFERMSLSGLDEMDRYSRDPRLYEFLEYQPFSSREETQDYIERRLREIGSDVSGRTAMTWFVRRKSDFRLVGTARLVNVSHARQSAEWGYGVDPDLWGTGYILQLQAMLKHFVFELLRLNRLSGISMVANQRKCGMRGRPTRFFVRMVSITMVGCTRCLRVITSERFQAMQVHPAIILLRK